MSELDAFFDATGIREHDGYLGAFTTRQAPGAWPNGTRVFKARSESGDSTPNGTLGTVLGSIFEPSVSPGVFYFVEWDDKPRTAIGCHSAKLARKYG